MTLHCNIPKNNFHLLSVFGSSENFYPRRIYCVGANYLKHVSEMGLPGREKPFYFMKPSDSVIQTSREKIINLPYPTETNDFHHEVELVIVIGKEGRNITVESAKEFIFGTAVGLDMTKRDLQKKLREKKQPWELSKAFDFSAPIGLLHPFDQKKDLLDLEISLELNGVIKQKSDTSKMIFSVDQIISDLSKYSKLYPGDLLFTGTPEGVGPVERGDRIFAEIKGLSPMNIKIV